MTRTVRQASCPCGWWVELSGGMELSICPSCRQPLTYTVAVQQSKPDTKRFTVLKGGKA